jgi:hypothetical protein
MSDFVQQLKAALDAAPVIDPHTHLRPSRPEADNLADLVLYHHVWVELVSAGMPATTTTKAGLPHEVADPGIEPLERVKAALPYLCHIRGTTCGNLLRTMLEDLYDVPRGELTEDNVEQVFSLVSGRAADPGWRSHVLRERGHIQKSLTVDRLDQPACDASIGWGVEQNLNLVSGKQTPQQMLAAMEQQTGGSLRRAEDLGQMMYSLGRGHSQRPIHFVGLWLVPYFGFEETADSEIAAILARAADGRPLGRDDLSRFSSYAVRYFLQGLRDGPVRTIQLIVGAEVLPPHRSLTHWSPELPGALGRLAGEFEDFHFNCSSASDLYTQDLAILAKHVPNLSVAGYWWHTLYPFYIRKSIETRLDIVPANKIVAFFSDAYHAEWCYPKLKLVKQILGEVLADRVARGLLTEEAALSLPKELLFENAKRIYGVQS